MLAWPVPATLAHPAPFSYLDLRLTAAGVSGSLVVHDLDAAFELKLPDANALLDPTVARRHGPTLAAILEPRLRLRLDGREAVVRLREVEPVPDRQGLRFALEVESTAAPGRLDLETTVFPYDGTHQTFVNVYEGDALRHQAILDARHTTFTYYAGSWQGVGAVLATFLPAGAYHIAIGPDHLLFLLGLLLLGGSLARLGVIVTAFTIGHTRDAVAGGDGDLHPAGGDCRAAHRVEHRAGRRRQPARRRRRRRQPRPAAVDGRPVRPRPRLRVRVGAGRVRPARARPSAGRSSASTSASRSASSPSCCRSRPCWPRSAADSPLVAARLAMIGSIGVALAGALLVRPTRVLPRE